jgi:hypothetical protein
LLNARVRSDHKLEETAARSEAEIELANPATKDMSRGVLDS